MPVSFKRLLVNRYEQVTFDQIQGVLDNFGLTVWVKVGLKSVLPIENSGIADDLYRYVSKKMPPDEAQRSSLSADDYWSIIHFMLVSHGVTIPSEGVTEKNAAAVKL